MIEGLTTFLATALLLGMSAINPCPGAERPSTCGVESGAGPRAMTQAQTACEALPPSSKVDEYGDLKPVEEKARVEKLAALLKGESEDTKAFIIAYAGRNGRTGEALARADRAKGYLVEMSNSYNTRINTLDCGYRDAPATEIWMTRVGAAPPRCAPTVEPGEAQVKGRKGRHPSRRRSRAL